MPKTPSIVDLANMNLATPAHLELLDQEIAQNRSALNGRSMHLDADNPEMLQQDMRTWGQGFQSPDPAILRESIRRDEETKTKGQPPALNGYQKNDLHKRLQELEAKITTGMPTHEQMQQATHGNVEQFVAHQEYTLTEQRAYLAIMRILDPQREGISIEALRPYQGGTRSRMPWDKGWESLTFTEAEELEETLTTLDDSIYVRFLEMDVSGVTSPKLIQDKLGISLKVYEACKARLAQVRALGSVDAAPPVAAVPTPAPASGPSPLATRLRRTLEKRPTLTYQELLRSSYSSKVKVAAALDELRQADDPMVLRWDERQRQAEPQSAA